MDSLECTILSTDEEITEYERCLYEAFVIKGNNYNIWIKNKYIKAGDKRIRPNIPYKDLIVFAIKNDAKIIAVRVFNTNMDYTQIEMGGFKLKLVKENSYESIHLFNLEQKSIESTKNIIKLNNYIKNYLYNNGIKKIYGVCFGKHLRMYKALGMKPIKEKSFKIIKLFALEQDITPVPKKIENKIEEIMKDKVSI